MRRRRSRMLGAIFASAVALLAPDMAHAADDGFYGRLEGDLDLRFGAGIAVMREGPALSAFASALLLSSAGVYVNYTDAFDNSRAAPRSIAMGLVIEPLFLARTAFDMEHGGPRIDLGLDSFAIGVGTYWTAPTSPANPTNDPGLEVSIGLGIPLLARATGPVLGIRGALRWSPAALAATEKLGLVEQGGMLSITLAWRHIVPVHLVDGSDRAVR